LGPTSAMWWPKCRSKFFQIELQCRRRQERFTGHPDDGAPNTTGDTSRAIINPPVDAVQEFKYRRRATMHSLAHLGRSGSICLPNRVQMGFMGLCTTSSATVRWMPRTIFRPATRRTTTGARQACGGFPILRESGSVCRFRNAKTRASSDSIARAHCVGSVWAFLTDLLSIFYSYSSGAGCDLRSAYLFSYHGSGLSLWGATDRLRM